VPISAFAPPILRTTILTPDPDLSSTQQLDMEDGDSIDAMMEQVGGC
jgi:hypothetical protein